MIIDFHVHPFFKEVISSKADYCIRTFFNLKTGAVPIDIYLAQMEIGGIEKAVLLPIDLQRSCGCSIPSNDDVAKIVEMHPDKFIGFASVDPYREDAVREIERSVNELGLRGLKLVPYMQGFDPLDRKVYPIYEKAQELEIPIVIHAGMTYVRRGLLQHMHPLYLEKILLEFPDLKIVLSHFAWPWVMDAAVLAMRYDNVFIDISEPYSGTPYEHLRHMLMEAVPKRIVERFIADKIIFGSNFPRMEADKMVRAFERLDLREDVKRKILQENALKLLSK